jgi:hypothetical protein
MAVVPSGREEYRNARPFGGPWSSTYDRGGVIERSVDALDRGAIASALQRVDPKEHDEP